MKSGDVFSDNDPHVVQPAAHYVQTVCSVCKEPININTIYQINDVASCSFCYADHNLSRNVCPRPYRLPHPRKLVNRTEVKNRHSAWLKEMGIGQATCSITTIAATQAFIKNPTGGL